MKCSPRFHALAALALLSVVATLRAADADKLRIICFGAHPDDCEIKAGGSAALWAAQGHKVKFVSVSNGDIGHWRDAGGPLALRRKAEVEAAAKVLGIETQVLDIHDGEIMPTLENRRTLVRLIREWQADIVIAPRANDYHPDHRYTAILVQDAAYMVTVEFFCPDVPALKKNPVFFYSSDGFQKPCPFTPDVVVPLDAVVERKLDALLCIESQFVEGGCDGGPNQVPADPAENTKYRAGVRQMFAKHDQATAAQYRQKLVELCGADRGAKVQHAEAFEICEYGRRPSAEELKKLFPFYN